MKIKITKNTSNPLQRALNAPLDFGQRVEREKLLTMEKILSRLELLGMKRKDLAKEMGVSSARITTMLDGKNNFTLETLMRAAEALGCDYQSCFKPKPSMTVTFSGNAIIQHHDFIARSPKIKRDETRFSESSVAENDEVDAA